MNTREQYYNDVAKHLAEQSADICKMNECTEDEHNCESNAYFNYDPEDDLYELATICISDYCCKCYNSYVSLPFTGNSDDLLCELESNLLI